MRSRIAAASAMLAGVVVLIAAGIPSEHRPELRSHGELHGFVHVAVFATVALLSSWSTRSAARRALLCGFVALLGITTEVLEHILFHSVVEWTDMVLDAIGAVLGTSLGAMLAPRLLARRRTVSD